MDSSSKLPPAEDGAQGDEKRKKDKQATNCTPFCGHNCEFQGQHNELIMSLINLHESDRASLDAWKKYVINLSNDINEPLQDPNPNFRFPLLHWVATLGKVKAVQWLLTLEDRVSLRKGNTQGMSNATVLFSTVRYLHEGVKSKDPNKISNIFVNILESLLKRDPYLLSVQEGSNSNTVLHLCAQGEESSTAPFLMYLKRTLVKLKEILNKNESLPFNWLKTILEQKNEQHDTFIDVAAKCKTQKEARELVDLILKQEFVLSVQKAEEILSQRKHNERENVDDDQNGDDDEDHVGTGDGENEAANENEQESTVCVPGLAVAGFSNLQQWDGESESKNTTLQDSAEALGSASTNRGVKRGSGDQSTTSDVAPETESVAGNEVLNEAKAGVEKLIQETKQHLLQRKQELEKYESAKAKIEDEIKRLQEEKERKDEDIKRRKVEVKAKEQKLNSYKEGLEKLG